MLLSLLAASLTRARFAGRVTRLCVRTPAFSRGSPSGRPLPSAHLASFGGIIGTMSRSDSQPRLDAALRFPLALRPRRRPTRRSRLGLLGSGDNPLNAMRSTTPVERHRLAKRRRTRGLQPWERHRPPPHSRFRGLPPAPRSTPVYASNPALPRRPQDSVPALPATALAGWDSHPSVIISFSQRTPTTC